MRRLVTVLCVLGLGAAALASEPVSMTFVVGSGYLLRQGDLVVAIDALVALDVPEVTRALMASALPPFDVDLILVTHSDPDHFDPAIVSGNMTANLHALLVAPADVVRAVRASGPTVDPARCVIVHPELDAPAKVEAASLSLDVYSFPHPYNKPENVGYRLQVGGLVLLHPGDLDIATAASDFARTGLDRFTADVAILPYFFFDTANRSVLTSCPARLYVPTHAAPAELSLACATARSTTYDVLCFTRPLKEAVLPPAAK